MKETMHLLRSGRISKEQALSKLASVVGWIKHAQCHNLYNAMEIDRIKKEVLEFEEIQ